MNIAIIYGGKSVENDISVITAIGLMNTLKDKYNVIPIYISKNGDFYSGNNLKSMHKYAQNRWQKGVFEVAFLPNKSKIYKKKFGKYKEYIHIDFCFLCNHGGNYEGGMIAGLLELSGIPYSSSSMISSGLCQDKVYTKIFAEYNKINVVPFYVTTLSDYQFDTEKIVKNIKKLGTKIILKPANLGSSVGIKVIDNIDDIDDVIYDVFRYDDKVIAEKYINNMQEINISAVKIDNEVILSNIEEPVKYDEILSFSDKYITNNQKNGMENMRKILCPNIDPISKSYIEESTKSLYEKMDLFGIVRFDYIIDRDENKVYLNEVNNIPGSLANYLYKGKYTYPKLCDLVIREGVKRLRKENEKITNFRSSIFDNTELNGQKFNK